MTHPSDAELSELLTLADGVAAANAEESRLGTLTGALYTHPEYEAWGDAQFAVMDAEAAFRRAATVAVLAPLIREILERRKAAPLATFGAWAIHESRTGVIDGGDAQDKATELGVLAVVQVTGRCGDACRCEEYDNIPGDCYRYSPDVAAYLVALPEDTTPNE